MKHSCLSSTLGGKTLKLAFCSLLLVLLFSEKTRAQPGYVPTVAELEKQLQPDLQKLAIQIANNPKDALPYLERAKLYYMLYERAVYKKSPADFYSEKALADASTAIKLNPTGEAYNVRAEFHRMFLYYDSTSRDMEPEQLVSFYLKNTDFDLARSDFLKAIRLGKDNDNLLTYFGNLSRLHSDRAQHLSNASSELRARWGRYSLWDDFDVAAEYQKKVFELGPKSVDNYPTDYDNRVAYVYDTKGNAAYRLGEYDIALDAFQQGDKYLNSRYFQIRPYYERWGDTLIKKNLPAQAIEVFTKALNIPLCNCYDLFVRRGLLYEKMGNLQKALDDYTAGLDKSAFAGLSGELYIRRA
ncbi:MAG TPA: hypothetical protein VLR90_17595, partial [Blastocatellia bacterium]|nr:hypothetical protein [Blastocatellia bacterium]